MGCQRCNRFAVKKKISWSICLKLLLGGLFFLVLPRQGIIDGSTRIIPFFALLMAGVLPAMMQTVTALKGDDLTPKAIIEYKFALDELLKFWAAIFGTALSAVGALTFAVVLNASPDAIPIPFIDYFISKFFLVDIFIFIFGLSATSVFLRLSSAYGGLKSLLALNFQFAEKKGQKNAAIAAEKLTREIVEPSVKTFEDK